jgi:glycerol-1-phosphate dehydrogenase [NAD(P)+]
MSREILDRLLAGTLADPDGAGRLSVPLRAVAIAPSLAGREAALVGALGFGRRLTVVSDPTTRRVLGERVAKALAPLSAVEEIVLDEAPHADDGTVAAIRGRTKAADALIAVGSGTINDLCKYAAFLDDKPYAVFGTAPSMNGYTSMSAAITEHGHKKSLPARPPLGVFLELEVLSRAPERMIRSGLGDSACRPTAQADQPYREAPFVLLREDEDALLANAAGLMAGDLAAMETLARTLVLSGLGMTICGGSYPASQGEHLISHYIDMLGDPGWPASFHGEHIAVATLTMARIQESLLKNGAPVLSADHETQGDFERRFGAELGASCWAAFAKKALSPSDADALRQRLARDWEEISGRLAAVTRPRAEIERALKAAGAPIGPSDIHVPQVFYREAVLHAREIRERYGFLDLAAEAGQLAGLAKAA